MIKQFAIIFSMLALISIQIFAQENPVNIKHETQLKSDTQNEDSLDKEESTTQGIIWNKVCPVKGNPVEKDSPTVEYNGKLYGFCCPGCDTKFAKNPEKYTKNLSEDGTKFIGRK
jgi:YHS domain-containing protein